MPINTSPTLGVIVGRFQVATLHPGHRHLINSVLSQCDQVLIIIGSSQGLASARNPLSFEARKFMLARAYPSAIIREHLDQPTNELWSVKLDDLIANVASVATVTLFGSRDSFIPHYCGKYPTSVIAPFEARSGTTIRNQLRQRIGTSMAWRQGVIHAAVTRPPLIYGTVDIAVLRCQDVLLGEKKQDNGKLRFIGGFLDPSDPSDEMAARRELTEEAGSFEVDDFKYVGSKKINDWRYRDGPDGIMTRFFAATYVFGKPIPGDDIDVLHWVQRESVSERLIESHQPLGLILKEFLNKHPTL